MTATLAPPPAAAPPPPEPAPRPRSHPRGSRWPGGPWVTELLLLAVTLVAAAGCARLFADATAVVPLLVAAVGAHLAGAVGRRCGWGRAATVALFAGALVLQVSIVLYPHTAALGLPTPATLAAGGDDLRRAWEQLGEVRAPAPRSRGFLLAATVALWAVAGLADWAAFRLRLVAEAVLPASALFVLTTLLGRGRGGVALAALLVAAVLAFTAAQRGRRSVRDDAWAGRADPARIARAGALVALVVAVVGGLVGPHLPTAGEEALVDWRGEQQPGGRTTVSPLVDIRSRLVEQSDDIVFTVRAERGSYWRAATLTRFDGRFWGYEEGFDAADGGLADEPPGAATETLVQEFTMAALDGIYAPAAPTPTELVESSIDLDWSEELSTLIVADDDATIEGATYTVGSATTSFTREDLDRPQPEDRPAAVEEATEVPEGLPAVVAETAAAVVAGVDATPYARMRALQDWFRSEFTYDLERVDAGHDGTAIEAFLEERRGYCEQFAGTFAAMARTLGLPSRVAVGFTMGEPTPDGTGFTVRGRNAHAWPEVWFAGAGWVPFEPTPGAGMPGAEGYTGLVPQQPGEPGLTTPTTPSDTRPPTTPPPTTSPSPTPSTVPTTTAPDEPGGGEATVPGTGDDGGSPAGPVAALLVVLAGLVLLALDGTAAGRVRAAWTRSVAALDLVGVTPVPTETAREFARRASDDLGEAGPALSRLAGMVTVTTWAPRPSRAASDLGRQADELARRITTRVHDDAGWRARARAAVDPRTLRSP